MTNKELQKVAESWAAAERSHDWQTLDKLLTADFEAIGPAGYVLTREQWLDRYRSQTFVNKRFDWGDLEERDYGDTAILRGVQTNESEYHGNPVSATCRGTQVFVRQGGAWKLASMQLSAMAGPPGAGTNFNVGGAGPSGR